MAKLSLAYMRRLNARAGENDLVLDITYLRNYLLKYIHTKDHKTEVFFYLFCLLSLPTLRRPEKKNTSLFYS